MQCVLDFIEKPTRHCTYLHYLSKAVINPHSRDHIIRHGNTQSYSKYSGNLQHHQSTPSEQILADLTYLSLISLPLIPLRLRRIPQQDRQASDKEIDATIQQKQRSLPDVQLRVAGSEATIRVWIIVGEHLTDLCEAVWQDGQAIEC